MILCWADNGLMKATGKDESITDTAGFFLHRKVLDVLDEKSSTFYLGPPKPG